MKESWVPMATTIGWKRSLSFWGPVHFQGLNGVLWKTSREYRRLGRCRVIFRVVLSWSFRPEDPIWIPGASHSVGEWRDAWWWMIGDLLPFIMTYQSCLHHDASQFQMCLDALPPLQQIWHALLRVWRKWRGHQLPWRRRVDSGSLVGFMYSCHYSSGIPACFSNSSVLTDVAGASALCHQRSHRMATNKVHRIEVADFRPTKLTKWKVVGPGASCQVHTAVLTPVTQTSTLLFCAFTPLWKRKPVVSPCVKVQLFEAFECHEDFWSYITYGWESEDFLKWNHWNHSSHHFSPT